MPNVSRSLLLYRYRRLPEARLAARRAGYLGAMYPWQSGSDGREVSQEVHLNPQSGRWNPDASARAHHVGLAIAYNAWQHYQVTGDRQCLIDHGAEILAEIARFWLGLATFDDSRGRYAIRGVIGPDEFHSGYPGKEYDGIDNNAYTNVLAVWVILRAMDVLDLLPLRDRLDLVGKLDLKAEELDRWHHVTRRMFVPFHDEVISQFKGYSELAELDWNGHRERYGNIQRLDRILEAENDSVNNYKASKQADALMLFYLLSSDELLAVFGRLGYRFAPEQIPKTVDYYLVAHLGRIDAQRHRPFVGACPRQPAPRHEVLRAGARFRHRRHPGRHHIGRNTPGRDGRQRRPAATVFHRAGNARRPTGPRPAVAGSARPHRVPVRIPRPTSSPPDQRTDRRADL